LEAFNSRGKHFAAFENGRQTSANRERSWFAVKLLRRLAEQIFDRSPKLAVVDEAKYLRLPLAFFPFFFFSSFESSRLSFFCVFCCAREVRKKKEFKTA
jgi:hypothetical protein